MAYFGMIIKEAEGNLCEYVDIHLINVQSELSFFLAMDS